MRRECRMRETRIRKTPAIEMRAYGAKARPAAHGADGHSSSHASNGGAVHCPTHASNGATVHSSSHHSSSHAASAKSRRGKSKCCAERTSGEAVQELVVHPNSSF